MFVVDRSPNVFISAYASVIGTEPITNEGGTLDFVFFMPQQRRSDHSRPARLTVLGVVFDEKEGLFLNGFPKRRIGSLFERPMWFLTG